MSVLASVPMLAVMVLSASASYCWLDEHDGLENNEKNLLLFVDDFRKEVSKRIYRKYHEL